MPRSTGQLYQDLAKVLNELESREDNVDIDYCAISGHSGEVNWDNSDPTKPWQARILGGKEE